MIKSLYLTLLLLLMVGCSQSTKYAVVQEGTKDGVINETGYVVVKPIYEHVFEFDGQEAIFDHPNLVNLHWIHNKSSEAYAVVQSKDGKFGVVNQKGTLLLKPIYESITHFFNGFMRIEAGGKFGLVNSDFKIVLKPTYDYVGEFAGDIAIVHHDKKYGCINRDIELKIKPIYDRIYFQQEEFLRTTLKEKWGYLDNQCNVLAKPIYDYGYDFSNGFAKVILSGKVGYLNSDGKLISKQVFTKESASF